MEGRVRKLRGRGKLGGMWLPEGTLDDGILWLTTKAEQSPESSPQTDKHGRDGRTTPATRLTANKQEFGSERHG